jgi:hypothetical protein
MNFCLKFFPKYLFTMAIGLSIGGSIRAQNDTIARPLSKVEFVVSGRIDSLERAKRGKTEIKGYRIQIFLGPFAQAKTARANFVSLGFGYAAYMPQNAPDYAVRIGDFRSRLEAMEAIEKIKAHYPDAIIVADRVEPPRFGHHKQ